MKDFQPADTSLPRVQRIRNVPIERIPSPNTVSSSSDNNHVPKKLNQEDRFRLHSSQVERKIVPGAAFLPPIRHQQQQPHHRLHGISLAEHHRRFDGTRDKPQPHHSQTSHTLRSTPFGDSLRRRNTSSPYEPSSGIQLVAQYGVQDTYSTASTPTASKSTAFPSTSVRGNSLPTSHSITLPSHYYRPMPARSIPHHQNHHHHHQHPRITESVVPEIEASGLPQDPVIEAERQEPDYHLVESGSDVHLSTKDDVPEPAPYSAIGATTGTVIDVPETDILDSSCSSDEDDDVVRNCDVEANGNARGLHHDDDSAGTSGDEVDEKELYELMEREQIVEKYEKGPEEAVVDDWENPDFELFKITDRYGFVHKSVEDIEADKRQKEQDRIKKEIRRESKWLRMIDEWKTRHPAKLPVRIWKGVPEKLRSTIWQKMLGSEELKKGAKPNLYSELVMRARLVSPDIRQIDLDINRTYRDHLAFRKRYDVKQQSLFSVLAAYAMYNTEIGYCQGMSQIAALFLMYMDEEDAFWCMHSLMVSRRYTMHGMFVPGFPKLHRFQEHYEKVLIKYLPKLYKHFEHEGVPLSYLTKWWFGCFLDRVPFPLALRVWDVFLYFGDSILIAMAYNLMELHHKALKKMSMEKILDFVQSGMHKDIGFTFDHVMDNLKKCLEKLRKDRMALPHPAPPNAIPETPQKPLGPILTRSMVDIRMDIAELHSRGSRANSVHGRSPAPRRKNKSPLLSNKHTSTRPPTGPVSLTTIGGASSSVTNGTTSPPLQSEVAPPLPPDPFRKHITPLKPVIPDSDGFVPMSPRKATNNRSSVYDNVPQTSGTSNEPNVFGYGNHFRTASNRSHHDSIRHTRDSSAERIHRAPNNVTYVAVGEELPTIPVPDYEGADDRFQMRSEKLLRTASAYQARRVQTSGGGERILPQQPTIQSHSRPLNSSLKQRPPQQANYYFDPDPPGVPRDSSSSPNRFNNGTPRHKHSFV